MNIDTTNNSMDFDLLSYDKYIVSFSGGKDSTACLLYLLDNGVPKEKIELWHQEIDGRGPSLFDWEITPDYCRQVGAAFGIPVLFQWKEGGFTREMLREDSLTAPIHFELPDGTSVKVGGERGKPSTRRRFPQPSPDLRVRWCSAYLKIDVCATALRHDPRFQGIRTLVLSGERGENCGQYGKDRFMLAVHEKIIGGGSRCIWKTTCKWPEGTPMKVLEDKLRAEANKHGYFETTYETLH